MKSTRKCNMLVMAMGVIFFTNALLINVRRSRTAGWTDN